MPWSLPLRLDPCGPWGNDFREVAAASFYLGEMILDVTLILYAAVDAGFAEETYNKKKKKKTYNMETI